MTDLMAKKSDALTVERVEAAYGALGTGDRVAIEEFWDPELTWQAAGCSRVSRTYRGLDEFIGFLTTMGELSGGSLAMDFVSILVGDATAVALTHNTATRADDPARRMDIEEVHFLSWRDGRIVSGRGAMLGGGTAEFEEFVA
ncbi:nuclear transport factor 2 family protein [Streptomyces sp. NBC_01136]|uniref:nuclear transport factor 2 family protein n=1 Tax=unclassified Streptomyces TaxID=2593676 RepID=UPI00324DED16|nr:nuclear transport factor 2 family protein [Streptomyces sp. NBC_01136]